MVTRAQKIGTKRPRGVDAAPLPPSWLIMLDELPSDLGLELAMLARQIFLAAAESTSETPLYRDEVAGHVTDRRLEALAAAPADLAADLHTLMRVTEPGPVDAPGLACACAFVSDWARNAGHLRTAAVLAEAGAAIAPEDPEAAFNAGRANRILEEVWRAEVFYRRAIHYAYRLLNWDIYIRAHLGQGRLMADTGRRHMAEELYATAASTAASEGSEWLAAQTYHDLLVLHFDGGDLGKALEYACKAIRLYPTHNERFPLAVHDLAFVLVAQQHVGPALPMLESVVRAPLDPEHQVLVSGTLARAAGIAGRVDLVAAAERTITQLAPRHDFHAAFATMNLAYGMRALTQWDRAAEYVEEALRLAAATDVEYVMTHGRELLRDVQSRTPVPPPACGLTGEVADELKALGETLGTRVAAWHTGPGWNARWSASQNGPRSLGVV